MEGRSCGLADRLLDTAHLSMPHKTMPIREILYEVVKRHPMRAVNKKAANDNSAAARQ